MELLVVIAIIGILAALLLPVLAQAKARAQRAQCVSNLKQVGVSFHTFAHDHNSQFPMQVSTNAGGSLEFAQIATRFAGQVSLTFRHFLPLSNDLVTPRVLNCPSDTRQPTNSFAFFGDNNLSYFVAVTARYDSPGSLLSGDRNLTNDYAASGSLVQLNTDSYLRWTDELHRFKGDLLFADAHVEERSKPGLVGSAALGNGATMLLPTTGTAASGMGRSPGNNVAPQVPADTPGPPPGKASRPAPTMNPPSGQPPIRPPMKPMDYPSGATVGGGGLAATDVGTGPVSPTHTNLNPPVVPPPKPPVEPATNLPTVEWPAPAAAQPSPRDFWPIWLLMAILLFLLLVNYEVRRRLRSNRKRRLGLSR